MQIRIVRAGGLAVLGALLTLSAGRACSAQGLREDVPEDRLFGLRLLRSSYRDVLQKFGQPQEIQVGGPFAPTTGAPAGRSAGGQGGGLPGFGGGGPGLAGGPSLGGGAQGGGKRPTSKNGFPGKGGSSPSTPGTGGGPGGFPGGYPGGSGGYGGYPGQGGKGGGLPGFPGGGPSGYPGGYPGQGGQGGGDNGDGLPGGGPAGGDNADNQEKPETEATWWYHDTTSGLHKSFLFNKDGVLIQMQEYGQDIKKRGDRTRQGVGLGSGLGLVLSKYGWSSDGAHDGSNMIMRYGNGDFKVAFQLVKNPAGQNAVIGITIGVVK